MVVCEPSFHLDNSTNEENCPSHRLSETHTSSAQLPSITLRPVSTSGASTATPSPLKLQPKSASHDSEKTAKAAQFSNIFKEWISSLPDHGLVILSHGSLLNIPHGDSFQSFAVKFPPKSLPSQPQQEDSKSHPEPEVFSIQTKNQLSQLKVEIGQAQGISYVFKKYVLPRSNSLLYIKAA